MAALDDRPHPGKVPTITMEAKAWLTDLACRKAKEFNYPHELWTTRLLARHAREYGPAEGHARAAVAGVLTTPSLLSPRAVGAAGDLLPPRRAGAADAGASPARCVRTHAHGSGDFARRDQSVASAISDPSRAVSRASPTIVAIQCRSNRGRPAGEARRALRRDGTCIVV
jgi:hypothetical protein